MKDTVHLASDIAGILRVRAAVEGDSVDHLIDGILREKLLIPHKVKRRKTKPFRVKPHNFGGMLSPNLNQPNYNHFNDELQDLEFLNRLQKHHAASQA
jgi:hypothetical protein